MQMQLMASLSAFRGGARFLPPAAELASALGAFSPRQFVSRSLGMSVALTGKLLVGSAVRIHLGLKRDRLFKYPYHSIHTLPITIGAHTRAHTNKEVPEGKKKYSGGLESNIFIIIRGKG